MTMTSALYVPGDRSDRFDKAVASGADLVILDLEDAVAPNRKSIARAAVVDWLEDTPAGRRPAVEVRVNSGDTGDLAAVAGLGDRSRVGIRLPKVSSVSDVESVAELVEEVPICALVEDASGVEALLEIARHPRVTSVALGEADLASDLGTNDPIVLDWLRVRLIVAARAAGLPPPMMGVYVDVHDLKGLRTDSERGRSMGFVGRTAIHPSQVAVIVDAFRPTPAEVAWARAVLGAIADGGVDRLASGEMVDPAMRGRAEAILSLETRPRC
ncbi:CoA ester lyase [soil metagenome]